MEVHLITKDLENQLKKLTKSKERRLVKNYINTTLFEVRKFALGPRGMKSEFEIRNYGLIRSHIVIRKATYSTGGCVGYFGSLSSARFSGWEEQEKGTATRRKITIHRKHARGASGKRSLQKKFRRNQKMPNLLTNQKNTNSYQDMISATLAILRREGYSGPVFLPVGYYKRPAGIYNLRKTGKYTSKSRSGNTILRTQNKKTLKLMEIFKTKQPEKNKWGTDIVNKYLKVHDSKKIVEKELERMLRY